MTLEDPAGQAADSPAAEPLQVGEFGAAPEGRGPGVMSRVGLFAAGLVIAAVGVAVIASRTLIRGVSVPWGLVVVLVALAVCVRAGAWSIGSRRGAALVGAGWALLTLVFAMVSPGGDVLLPDLPRTYVYLGGGAVLVLVATLWPLPSGARELAEGLRTEPQPED